MKRFLACLAVVALLAALGPAVIAPPAVRAQSPRVVKILAGSPGYDHIQPFMAEKLGFWEKYGLKVEFIGGNYVRSNNMMSTGTSTPATTRWRMPSGTTPPAFPSSSRALRRRTAPSSSPTPPSSRGRT
jgi:hypothetical protein